MILFWVLRLSSSFVCIAIVIEKPSHLLKAKIKNISLSVIRVLFINKKLTIKQNYQYKKPFDQKKVFDYRKKNESFKIINLLFAFVGIRVAIFLVAIYQNVRNKALVGLSLFFVLLGELFIIVSQNLFV